MKTMSFSVSLNRMQGLKYITNTTCSSTLSEELTGPKLIKKFPAFYGT
jgi:hypothetical protein